MAINLGDIRHFCGDVSQLASAVASTMTDGASAGVRTIEVRTFGGLSATVLVDRALDVGAAWVGSTPLSWTSAAGVVHPSYTTDDTWLRSFPGGLLTTAGLINAGPASFHGDQRYGLHGRISNTPASNVHVETQDTREGPRLVITGRVREASVYGPDLQLNRRLVFHVGEPVLEVHDEVTNLGWGPSPLMILYHFNIGYPVISPDAELRIASIDRRSVGASPRGSWNEFVDPNELAGPEVYEHEFGPEEHRGATIVTRHGPLGPLGLRISWQRSQLPRMLQWRMLAKGMYLTGLEPSNCRARGVDVEAAEGTLEYLQPGERRRFDLQIAAADTAEALDRITA